MWYRQSHRKRIRPVKFLCVDRCAAALADGLNTCLLFHLSSSSKLSNLQSVNKLFVSRQSVNERIIVTSLILCDLPFQRLFCFGRLCRHLKSAGNRNTNTLCYFLLTLVPVFHQHPVVLSSNSRQCYFSCILRAHNYALTLLRFQCFRVFTLSTGTVPILVIIRT